MVHRVSHHRLDLGAQPRHQIETLERRTLLADVFWDGGGDGINLTDPGNWSNDTLPTINDDVTVDVPSFPALQLRGGTIQMRSLVLRELLTIGLGGLLGIATTAQSDLSIACDGGTISGGTLTFGTGAALVAGSSGGTLDGVDSIVGDLLLSATNASLSITNGLAVTGTIRLAVGSARLIFVGTQTFAAGTIRFQSTSGSPDIVIDSGTLTLGPATSIQAAPGARGNLLDGHLVNRGIIEIAGASTRIEFETADTVRNEGIMRATAGGWLSVVATTQLTNETSGTLEAVNTGTLAIQGSDQDIHNVNTRFWRNNGAILLNNGIIRLGGTFKTSEIGSFQRAGGSVLLNGMVDNTNATLNFDAATGSWAFANGRIVGGTVNLTEGTVLTGAGSRGRLVGPITVNGNISDLGTLVIEGGLYLNGTATVRTGLDFDGSQIVTAGTLEVTRVPDPPPLTSPVGLTLLGNAIVTLGVNVILRGAGLQLGARFDGDTGASTLINEGLIELRPAGVRAAINPGNLFVNAGTLRLLESADLRIAPGGQGALNEGLIQIAHECDVSIDVTLSNTGTIDLGGRMEYHPGGAALLESLAEQVISGYAGGAWNGTGIHSSRAAANPGYGVGINQIGPNDLAVRYVRLGDADTAGGVTLSDFNALAFNFGQPGTRRWHQGDFNYDRTVNLSDFNLLAANFGLAVGAQAVDGSVAAGAYARAAFVSPNGFRGPRTFDPLPDEKIALSEDSLAILS